MKIMNWKNLFTRVGKKENINLADDNDWCHYSDLPSPSAYQECADYDGMGDYSRCPKIVKK